MFEYHDEAVKLNPQYLEKWNIDRALVAIGAPIHPGAVQYYQEAGVWTDEIDAQNEAIKAMERRE